MSTISRHSVEWIDNAGPGWEERRFKALFEDSSDSISTSEMEPLEVDHYSIPSFDDGGSPSVEDGASIDSNKKRLKGGEILFSKLNSHKPRVWLVSACGERVKVASTEFLTLVPWAGANVCKEYFVYLLSSAALINYIACFQSAVTNSHRRIKQRNLLQAHTFLPAFPEQKRIAAYLDASCAAIDRAVATKQQQLETLEALRKSIIQKAVTQGLNPEVELKESGVAWMGPIPKHWRARKLKRVFSDVEYGTSESTEEEGNYAVLKMGNIVKGEIAFTKIEYLAEVDEELLLDANDLLFNRTNSLDQVAKVGLFRGTKKDRVTYASYLVRLRTTHQNHPEFINYLVNADIFLGLARKMAIPSVQQANLNPTRYCRLEIPVPPLDEQKLIAEHLREKCAQLGELEKLLSSQVTTLTAYRKSLIHECVTGQRRITDAEVAAVSRTIEPGTKRG
jgi:type I restriction enzyme S subunit